MTEVERKKRFIVKDVFKIKELQHWFDFDYPRRLNAIERYKYLGLTGTETRYDLEMEAYQKENELRKLKGLQPLPDVKIQNIL